MNIFSKLFGGGKPAPEPVVYKDFRIFADPVKEAGGYRISARIEKDFGDETKTHQMVRADTVPSLEEALGATVDKAKFFIDQMGDRIFG
ncbi:HlyU family transcriptional regulator [Marivivens marinus]|uniref:HlyU family transcriptional regulator n=1 Tax=Marivivens marinus TaxID=3110173 RepID=UPI003B846464